jgi:hypothetical protein
VAADESADGREKIHFRFFWVFSFARWICVEMQLLVICVCVEGVMTVVCDGFRVKF